jgi:hypothetical protein
LFYRDLKEPLWEAERVSLPLCVFVYLVVTLTTISSFLPTSHIAFFINQHEVLYSACVRCFISTLLRHEDELIGSVDVIN